MAKAKTTVDVPGWAAVKAAEKRKATRKKSLTTKTFEQLSNAEKDQLLKTLAVQAGLVQDSE